MKRYAVLAFAVAASASHAVLTPIGFFPTPAPWQENFDSLTAGSYNTLPIFSGWGVASKIGGGQIVVAPISTAFSAPNILFGQQADVRIVAAIPMRRFGGYFESAPVGVIVTAATFKFYNAANVLIGSQTVPIGTTWSWIGFKTAPKWKRVEIYGNISAPGFVGMDSIRMRAW